ncbi:DUF7178 family protein [Streptomyces solincola]|uniref:DUF7178 family protein n=1 Tax=Streptomyces solincola TaxID=2100817 RepID=UPI0021597468|nr:hypothetical protein [Streptomyces solincola]
MINMKTLTPEEREQFVINIMDEYAKASPDQLARGRAWYLTAHQLADMISEGNVMAGAGVIAALSAQKSWAENSRLASRAFESGAPSGHTGETLAKAAKIMAGADPAVVLPMTAKTGNFYRCILDPEDAEAVCIDRHAHDIAVGETYGSRDRGLSAKTRYAVVAHAYREAAMRLGELPSTVQAVTWVVRTEGIAGTATRPKNR